MVKALVWTALIAMALLRHVQLLSCTGRLLSNVVAGLRIVLFTYRYVQDWFDQPFATPPDPGAVSQQQTLAFA